MEAVRQVVGILLYSERLRNIAAVVGLLYLLKVVVGELWSLAGGFRAFFLAPWGISRTNLRKYGQWAVVTGASEGIGRGYALELARQGLDVVIMSRSEEKLQKVASEIKEKYGREVRVIAVDFSAGQDIYPQIAEELKDLDIGILVNNVGTSIKFPQFLSEISEMTLRNIVELNCQALVQMTRLVLPKMVEKKRGAVVNISSVLGSIVFPLTSVYGATKAFVDYFSAALHKEYEPKGIYIQNVKPYMVATAMTRMRKVRPGIPNGEDYGRAAVATIGLQKNTNGYWQHAVQNYIIRKIPIWLMDYLVWKIAMAVRARELRKMAKQQ